MTTSTLYTVRIADWNADGPPLRAIRRTVFVDEQGVPEVLEWDDLDAQSAHALAVDAGGAAIGCARLLPDGHIGRVAVLRPWRRRGVGAALLLRLVDLASERGHAAAVLNAQTQAIAFYRRHGFEVTGDVFEEAGIPHVVMQRALQR